MEKMRERRHALGANTLACQITHLVSSLYFLCRVFLYSYWFSHSCAACALSGLWLLGSPSSD